MKHATIAFALLLSAALSACDSPLFVDADDVRLDTDRSLYAPGDTAIMRIENESGEWIGYNLCAHLVQRWDGERWRDTLYGDDGPCFAMWFELEHGDRDTYPAALDPAIPVGTYRFRTRIDTPSEGEFSIHSETFDVE